ncbi:carotenoid cleavage dioxygenase [Nakamurella sp. UYEF19]|uniref:carotenoid oxygenase family protein n=1 Tax=Nakamurella sp. UYEF19 TaxID=1756392 RepID=UPI003396BF46
MTTSPFLLGAFAPVFRETTALTFPVTGRIPPDLNGLFTQIGPNPIRPPRHTDTDRYQWFAQDGMVSGVRLQEGTAQWFRNRWVRSTRVTRALGESRTPGRRHFPIGTVHTNVVSHAGLLLALVETGCTAVQLTPELDTVRYTDVNGTLPHGASAHPKFDPVTGELHAVVYSPLRTFAEYRVLDRAGALLSSRRVDLGGRPMLHDIALTKTHVVLFDLPVRFQIGPAVIGRFPYQWDEHYQARVGILPRQGDGGVRWFPIEPCFLFHTVGATETATHLTVKGIRYRRLFDSGAADPLTQAGQLWQWNINLVTGSVIEGQLDDLLQELPRINPDHITSGARYHYAITAGSDHISSHSPQSLLKYDHRTGQGLIRPEAPHTVPTEAVYVPRPGPPTGSSESQDDGWVLHFSYDEQRQASDLVIIDAQNFTGEPAAVIHLPVKVPFGFHSSWIADTDLR